MLGPLEVWHNGTRLTVGGPRNQLVLALLLVNAGRVVPRDQLVDALWPDDPPTTARAQLQNCVSALRRMLGAAGAPADVITCRNSGYTLQLGDATLDMSVFEQLTQQARSMIDQRPSEATASFRESLKLWRGSCLAGISNRHIQAEAARLDEKRLATIEECVDVELRLGRHHELIGELSALADEHPLREPFHARLILALVRAGRRAEALAAYRCCRDLLRESLGLDPGPALQSLYVRILQADPDLVAPEAGPSEPRPMQHNTLPRDMPDFTGRAPEMDLLLTAIADRRESTGVTVAIDGMAGVGKTTLAVHAAHQLARDYLDAQVYVDLQGHTVGQEPRSAADALNILLRALGLRAEQIPEDTWHRAGLWRTELEGREAIVVLDNALDADQVRPLLPSTRGCLVLITSRRRLVDLEGVHPLTLGVMSPPDADALFARIVGEARTRTDPEAAGEAVRLCGRLPLAIRFAAARLSHRPTWTIAHLVERLRDAHRRLSELHGGTQDIAAAFTLSYQYLNSGQQKMFRLLGMHAGVDIDLRAASALAGLPEIEAERALEELLDVHLVDQSVAGRYRLHDLVRTFAANLTASHETERERKAAMRRLTDFYLHSCAAADRYLAPHRQHPDLSPPADRVEPMVFDGYEHALRWCDAERANLVAATHSAARYELHAHAWQLPWCLWGFLNLRKPWVDWIGTHRTALAAARHLADRCAERSILNNLAGAYYDLRNYRDALECFQAALALAESAEDTSATGSALANLGSTYQKVGLYDEAFKCSRRALAISRELGNQWLEGVVLNNLGEIHAELNRHEAALGYFRQALAQYRLLEDLKLTGVALMDIGETYRHMGRHQDTLDHFLRALTVFRQVGDRWGTAETLARLGRVHLDTDDLAAAQRSWWNALRIFEELSDPSAEEVRGQIAQLDGIDLSV